MSRPGFWLTIGSVALVVVALCAWRITSAPAQTAAASGAAELQDVKRELMELKSTLRDSQRPAPPLLPPNALAVAPAAPPAPPAPPGSDESSRPEEPPVATGEEFEALMKARQEESAKKVKARRERIDRTLQAEGRDARWASEATKTIQGWLVDPGLAGARLEDVDCRTSMCRAHISLPEGKRVDDFIMTTMDKMGTFQTTSLHLVDNDGSKREFFAYLGRQGQPLPQ